MSFMNEFLERNWDTMNAFLCDVSSPGSAMHLTAYEDSIDLALELSILHSLLCNIFCSLDKVLAAASGLVCAWLCLASTFWAFLPPSGYSANSWLSCKAKHGTGLYVHQKLSGRLPL